MNILSKHFLVSECRESTFTCLLSIQLKWALIPGLDQHAYTFFYKNNNKIFIPNRSNNQRQRLSNFISAVTLFLLLVQLLKHKLPIQKNVIHYALTPTSIFYRSSEFNYVNKALVVDNHLVSHSTGKIREIWINFFFKNSSRFNWKNNREINYANI